MKTQYKGYVIDVSSSEELGRWQATAKMTPTRAGMKELKGLALLIVGGFLTQAEAESEALQAAKQNIDKAVSSGNHSGK